MDLNRQATISKKTKKRIEKEEKIISQYPMLKEEQESHSMADSMLQTKEEVKVPVKMEPYNVPYENAMVYGGKT